MQKANSVSELKNCPLSLPRRSSSKGRSAEEQEMARIAILGEFDASREPRVATGRQSNTPPISWV